MDFRRSWICLALCLTLSAAPLAAGEGFWSSIGPDGGAITALAAAPSHPFVLYAGVAGRGLYRSTNRGRSWGFTGSPGALIHDLAVDPTDPGILYAALETGLSKSTDGGASFQGIGPEFAPTTLVEVHPRDPEILFFVLGGVLYRSTDHGATRSTEPGWPEGVRALRFVPGRPDVVYAGAHGLWKSTDAGASWRQVSEKPGQIAALAIDPRAPRVLYAGLASGALLKSTNGGVAWRRLLPGHGRPVTALVIDPASSSTIYAGVGGELLRSLDAGARWERAGAGLQGDLGDVLETTRYGLLAGTSSGLFLSTDRAATFQAADRGISFGIDELEIDGQDPPRLYVRLGSRVLATADRGAHWLDVGPPANLSDPPYFSNPSLAVASDDSQTLYLSESRNLAQSTDGGHSWTVVRNPCVILSDLLLDPRDSDHLFAEGHFLSGFCGRIPKALLHSQDGGQTWDQLIAVEWRYLAIDPLDSSAYVQDSSGDLWRIAGPSSRYELLFPGLSATALAVSPLVPGMLWAVRPGEVGRSLDGGLTWSFSSTGLPAGAVIFTLALAPADPATLYAGIPAQGVFKSTDAGETWSPMEVWPAGVRFQGGLLVDPADPSILYAGTGTAGVLMFDQED